MAKIGELYVAITGDNSSLKSSLNDSSKQVTSFGSTVTKQVASIVSVTAAIGLALKGIQFNAAAQSAQQAFSVMLGSASAAKDMLAELKTFANNTPLEFADIRSASQTLLQFGVDAKKIVPIVKQLGDVSGGDAQKLQSLALAFGQMSSTGRLMGQDLLQMINAGFNPLRIISEQTGKSMADLKKEMEAGAISSEMVADAFKSATSEGGQFFQMLEKQAKTINGAFSTLNDSVDTFLGKTTEGMSGPLVDAMTDASANLTKLSDNFTAVGDIMGGIIIIGSGLLNVLTTITDALNGQVLVLGAVAIGFSLAFGPIVGLIAAAVAAIAMITKGLDDNRRAQEEVNKKTKEATKYLEDYTVAGALAEKQLLRLAQAQKSAVQAKAESEALTKLMQEYRDAQKTKLQLINDEESATIAKAKKEGATAKDIAVINQYYAKQRKELLDEEAEYYQGIQDATVEAHEIARKKREETDAAAAQVVIDGIEAEKTWNQELEDATTEAHDIALANKEATDSAAAAAEIARIEATKQAEAKAFADRVALWSSFSGTVVSQIATISEATGAFFAGEESGWRGLANTAIKAIAGIVRALAHELEVKAAKALAEAVALSLGLNPAAIPKYAEAGGYALGVSGIYAGAGAIEALANFGAGTSAVPQSGSYLVGEYGPEMVTLPKGASVQTNAVTSANMGSTYNVTNVFNSPKAISAVEADRLSRKAMREQRAFA